MLKKLIKNTIESQTKEWFDARDMIITASDVSTVLGYNKYQDAQTLLANKLKNYRNIDSDSTSHGKKFEPMAVEYLSNKFGVKIHEPGLKLHPKLDYLGATPDGIFEKDGELFLLEIKCPLRRKIDGKIPYNYFCQMQVQMEVWDIDTCYFLELEIEERENQINNKKFYKKLGDNFVYIHSSNLVKVPRDTVWFNKHKNTMKVFVDNMRKKRCMKRKRRTVVEEEHTVKRTRTNTRSRRRQNKKSWINTSYLQDYIIDDKLHTWLELYGREYYTQERNCFSELIINRHTEYTKSLINDFNAKYNVYNIPKHSGYNEDIIDMTTRLIESKEYDLLINPILIDEENKIYTKIDMLIKGSILSEEKLFITDENIKYTIKNNLYYPVNICLSKIKLLANKDLSDSEIKYRYYKEKANIEIDFLNKCQTENVNLSFIWNNGIVFKHKEYQKHLFAMVSKKNDTYHSFIDWYRSIENTDKEDVDNNTDFYPIILGQKYSRWEKIEKMKAYELKELTLINNIGLKYRTILRKEGVFSYDDERFLKVLEQYNYNKKRLYITKHSMQNTEDVDLGSSHKTKWLKKHKLELYVDFETVNEFCGGKDMIYLIGMYVMPENKFYYFMTDKLTYKDELKIVNEWMDKMEELKKKYRVRNPPIYHWAPAEKTFLRKVEERNNIKLIEKMNFHDIYKSLLDNQVVFSGNIEGYSLKKIVKNMFNKGLIKMSYNNSKCSSGDKSIISALEYYNHNNMIEKDNIIHYNKIDCQIMFEILNALRNY